MASPISTYQGQGYPILELVAGPNKGRVIELSSERISLGRAAENEIVLSGEGISRQHAIMTLVDGQWIIRDNESKNGILVNAEKVPEAYLKNGDLVQIGHFVFRFQSPEIFQSEMPVESELPVVTEDPQMAGMLESVGEGPKPKKQGVNRRVLIYGIGGLLLAGLYMMSQDEGTKTAEEKKDEQKLARDFKQEKEPDLAVKNNDLKIAGIEDPLLKKAEQEMEKMDWTNASLKESEQFFRKGQREYLNKNYHRAIEAFQTSLALFRGHMLAERYMRRAIYEVELEAKLNMKIAVQYFESLQYQRALYHFQLVVQLMVHRPSEAIVGESERYIAQCKRRLQAADLFP